MPEPRVVLAVTGSIAAYKACEVLRRLRERGVDVRVAMTRNAAEFVGPLTFAALSGHEVLHDTFAGGHPEKLPHIRWAEECDAFCVVPASADFLAKMALGIADDFPSTVHLAVEGAVLVAPAMEDQMWAHPAVQANLETLRARGVVVVDPGSGPLASGRYGPGRLAEPEAIVEAIVGLLVGAGGRQPLAGLRVLVSAGPTREHLDPVRVLTNPASGKMGYALAETARRLGADVTLVSGPTQLPRPAGVFTIDVVTAEQMRAAVLDRAAAADVVVMAAAVSDFRPVAPLDEKLAKHDPSGLTVAFERTTDILAELAELDDVAGERTVVGFAAETSDLQARAREKLESKRCDLVVANVVGKPGAGFEADTNEVVIVDRLGGRREVGRAAKVEVAAAIWDAVVDFRRRRSAPRSEIAG